MKNAAHTIASASQRRLWFIRIFYLIQLSRRRSRCAHFRRERRAHRVGIALLAAVVAGTVAAAGGQARRAEVASCTPLPHDYAYDSAVQAALSSRSDLWGNQLLSTPGGPTYAAARRFLHPLMLVGPPAGKNPHRLTDSGIYYLAFGRPDDNAGARFVDLHVADGSQIVSRRVRGPSLSVDVGLRATSATAPVSRASLPRSWAAATCRS